MAVLFTRVISLSLVSLLAVALSGCGGGGEPSAPEQDELSQYIEDNPEILEEEEAMDQEMADEPERFE